MQGTILSRALAAAVVSGSGSGAGGGAGAGRRGDGGGSGGGGGDSLEMGAARCLLRLLAVAEATQSWGEVMGQLPLPPGAGGALVWAAGGGMEAQLAMQLVHGCQWGSCHGRPCAPVRARACALVTPNACMHRPALIVRSNCATPPPHAPAGPPQPGDEAGQVCARVQLFRAALLHLMRCGAFREAEVVAQCLVLLGR